MNDTANEQRGTTIINLLVEAKLAPEKAKDDGCELSKLPMLGYIPVPNGDPATWGSAADPGPFVRSRHRAANLTLHLQHSQPK